MESARKPSLSPARGAKSSFVSSGLVSSIESLAYFENVRVAQRPSREGTRGDVHIKRSFSGMPMFCSEHGLLLHQQIFEQWHGSPYRGTGPDGNAESDPVLHSIIARLGQGNKEHSEAKSPLFTSAM